MFAAIVIWHAAAARPSLRSDGSHTRSSERLSAVIRFHVPHLNGARLRQNGAGRLFLRRVGGLPPKHGTHSQTVWNRFPFQLPKLFWYLFWFGLLLGRFNSSSDDVVKPIEPSGSPLILQRKTHLEGWYARRGSNPQPSAPEADALSN